VDYFYFRLNSQNGQGAEKKCGPERQP